MRACVCACVRVHVRVRVCVCVYLLRDVQDHPLNRLHLWQAVGWPRLSDALVRTGVAHHPDYVLPAANYLLQVWEGSEGSM